MTAERDFSTVATPEAIREALERVLASETFAGAGRHSRLLRYLVDRTLAGEGDQLKEYVLGVDVFDRTQSYDPRLDSIVRVEARRLRARLEEYYAGPGAGASFRIMIPRGGYAPTFEPATASEAPAAAAAVVPLLAAPARSTAPSRSVTMVVVAAVLMFLVISAVSRIGPARGPAAQASTGPAIAVLPLQHYSARDADSLMAARLTDAITAELARLRTLAVASRTSSTQFSSETGAIAAVRNALHVDFVMEGSAVNDNGAVSVTIRVVDANRDRKVWVGQYKSTPGEIDSLANRIAREASEGTLTYHARTASDR